MIQPITAISGNTIVYRGFHISPSISGASQQFMGWSVDYPANQMHIDVPQLQLEQVLSYIDQFIAAVQAQVAAGG